MGEETEIADPGAGMRRRVGLVLVPLSFLLLFVPLPLEPRAHRLVAIFAAVVVAWITEVIPLAATALAIAPLLVIFDVCNAEAAFRSYADPLLFLFVGGFFLAAAMERHGLDRRLADRILAIPLARRTPLHVRGAVALVALLLSMWISNTATTAMLVPILLGMPGSERRAGRDPATGGLLALAYVSSTAGIGTLVGTPPNLIAARLLAEAGHPIGFLEFMVVGVPVAVLLSLGAFVVTARLAPPAERGEPLAIRPRSPMSRGERVTALGFGLAVVGWVLPDLLVAMGVEGAATLSRLAHPGAVALLASMPLFVVHTAPPPTEAALPSERTEPVLPWSVAVRIDWGVILLFGGGIALGKQIVDTGLGEVMSHAVVALTGVSSLWTLTAVAVVFTIYFTEVCSNTAATNMLAPLVIATAQEIGVSPVPPTLGVAIAASCAFMLPIATGPNAVVFGTGRVPQTAMVRSGAWLNVLGTIVVFAVLRVLCPLLGWD